MTTVARTEHSARWRSSLDHERLVNSGSLRLRLHLLQNAIWVDQPCETITSASDLLFALCAPFRFYHLGNQDVASWTHQVLLTLGHQKPKVSQEDIAANIFFLLIMNHIFVSFDLALLHRHKFRLMLL